MKIDSKIKYKQRSVNMVAASNPQTVCGLAQAVLTLLHCLLPATHTHSLTAVGRSNRDCQAR